ncbi:hypothetical protein ACA910_004309 [Epithemia clementina (nom. ined.)]
MGVPANTPVAILLDLDNDEGMIPLAMDDEPLKEVLPVAQALVERYFAKHNQKVLEQQQQQQQQRLRRQQQEQQEEQEQPAAMADAAQNAEEDHVVDDDEGQEKEEEEEEEEEEAAELEFIQLIRTPEMLTMTGRKNALDKKRPYIDTMAWRNNNDNDNDENEEGQEESQKQPPPPLQVDEHGQVDMTAMEAAMAAHDDNDHDDDDEYYDYVPQHPLPKRDHSRSARRRRRKQAKADDNNNNKPSVVVLFSFIYKNDTYHLADWLDPLYVLGRKHVVMDHINKDMNDNINDNDMNNKDDMNNKWMLYILLTDEEHEFIMPILNQAVWDPAGEQRPRHVRLQNKVERQLRQQIFLQQQQQQQGEEEPKKQEQ